MLDVQQRPAALRGMQDINLSQLEFASMPLSVSGGDIDNLTVVTTPGVTVSGRVAYQGQGAPKPGGQVLAVPPAGGSSPIGMLARLESARRWPDQSGRHVRAARRRRTSDHSRAGNTCWLGAEKRHPRWRGHHRRRVRLQARQQRHRIGRDADRSAERDYRQRARRSRPADSGLRARRIS